MAKPFLRWAGSKRKQIPRLREFWKTSYSRYVEPFAGSACFFLDIQPTKALISDKNAGLIETYEVVRDDAEAVYDRVVAIPRENMRYYAERSKNPARMSRFNRAVRFIYLNRNCFNGIYRTNRAGRFNVPFATSRAGAFVTREEFVSAAKLLQRATFRSCDFGACFSGEHQHLGCEHDGQLGDVGRTLPPEDCDRLLDLIRVAHGLTERLIHVGEDRGDRGVVARADTDHRGRKE